MLTTASFRDIKEVYPNHFQRQMVSKKENLRIGSSFGRSLTVLLFDCFFHLLLTSNLHARGFIVSAFDSKGCLLDYLSTTRLATCSSELPDYSFNSIKPTMLAALLIPCSYLKGLGHFSSSSTIDFCSNN